MKMVDGKLDGGISKFFSDDLQNELIRSEKVKDDDIIFIIGDKKNIVLNALGSLRVEIAKNMKWRGSKFELNNVWIKDQNDKLTFNCEDYYKKDMWFTQKKIKPRLKTFLRTIKSLIKNLFLRA